MNRTKITEHTTIQLLDEVAGEQGTGNIDKIYIQNKQQLKYCSDNTEWVCLNNFVKKFKPENFNRFSFLASGAEILIKMRSHSLWKSSEKKDRQIIRFFLKIRPPSSRKSYNRHCLAMFGLISLVIGSRADLVFFWVQGRILKLIIKILSTNFKN